MGVSWNVRAYDRRYSSLCTRNELAASRKWQRRWALHCGGVGPNLAEETAREIVANLRRFLAGRPLLYQLNRADVATTFEPPSH